MNTCQNDTNLLRISLKGNAVFSFISGLVFSFAHKSIADFIGFNQPVIILITGLSLLGFALCLYINGNRKVPSSLEAKVAVVLDLIWVFASILTVSAGLLNRGGNWAVIIIADIVLAFAILQFLGLHRIEKKNR